MSKTIFERDGKFYRRLSDEEIVQAEDLVAWAEDIDEDKRWISARSVANKTYAPVSQWAMKLAFLRECDPLTAAMRRALERSKHHERA